MVLLLSTSVRYPLSTPSTIINVSFIIIIYVTLITGEHTISRKTNICSLGCKPGTTDYRAVFMTHVLRSVLILSRTVLILSRTVLILSHTAATRELRPPRIQLSLVRSA